MPLAFFFSERFLRKFSDDSGPLSSPWCASPPCGAAWAGCSLSKNSGDADDAIALSYRARYRAAGVGRRLGIATLELAKAVV